MTADDWNDLCNCSPLHYHHVLKEIVDQSWYNFINANGMDLEWKASRMSVVDELNGSIRKAWSEEEE